MFWFHKPNSIILINSFLFIFNKFVWFYLFSHSSFSTHCKYILTINICKIIHYQRHKQTVLYIWLSFLIQNSITFILNKSLAHPKFFFSVFSVVKSRIYCSHIKILSDSVTRLIVPKFINRKMSIHSCHVNILNI